jgi:hypothetical protein
MVSLMETAIGERLLRTKILFEAAAWLEVNSKSMNKRFLMDLIREEQLRKEGIDGDGDIIGRYSYVTQIISKGKKRAGEPYTLFDTGAFYRGMFVIVLKDILKVESTSGSYIEMQDQLWWVDEIMSLTDENLQIYINWIKKDYIAYVRKVLQLD